MEVATTFVPYHTAMSGGATITPTVIISFFKKGLLAEIGHG
jgi:hypothetical protein